MSEMLKKLNQRPIAYYPIYRELTGSTTAGIMLSQLMYWFSHRNKIWKTDREIMEETLLSEKEIRNAKIIIKKLDFIKVTIEGVPAQTFYEINWEIYEKCLKNGGETSIAQRAELETLKGQNCNSPKGGTITETTPETTPEKEKKIIKKDLATEIEKETQKHENINLPAFGEWLELKKFKTIEPIRKLLQMLAQYSYAEQQMMIDSSIMNGYSGLFPPRNPPSQTRSIAVSSQKINTEINVWEVIEAAAGGAR